MVSNVSLRFIFQIKIQPRETEEQINYRLAENRISSDIYLTIQIPNNELSISRDIDFNCMLTPSRGQKGTIFHTYF